MTPYFSVIIPLYNKAKHIEATLQSVLNQTFEDFEVIIVNDGSTDGSLQVASSIKDKRIKIYTIVNQGVSHARNYGVEKSTSDYIAFLDADDYWLSCHLQNLKTLYDKFPKCGLYCAAYSSQIHDKKITSVYRNIPNEKNWTGIVNDFFESSQINCIAWTSAVMIPKHIFYSIGMFDETITLGAGEDTDLWIRVALKHPVAFCNTVSAIYFLGADNRISNTNTNLRKFINLDAYETLAKTNKSLKTYLDLNRYSIAIQYKLANNNNKAAEYIEKIDVSNLNFKQRLLLNKSTFVLRKVIQIQHLLQRNGFRLTAYS